MTNQLAHKDFFNTPAVKQKMMDELDLYSFISKINEYMAFGYCSKVVFNQNVQEHA
ncbi:hypothetical protein P9872_34 [Streptococcus phage 9872]|uniref:Uncharacterized protein n=1 Tax=Streptococcus phage 9872 TaxID=1814958 RepID=A0A191KBH2_9CAUD|nr:hypothetical protein BIZ99_gp34 [Streptococcus phage 9872]AMQ65777.1 hypothetical protein P9872_34 [Streptococcus phage 9872]